MSFLHLVHKGGLKPSTLVDGIKTNCCSCQLVLNKKLNISQFINQFIKCHHFLSLSLEPTLCRYTVYRSCHMPLWYISISVNVWLRNKNDLRYTFSKCLYTYSQYTKHHCKGISRSKWTAAETKPFVLEFVTKRMRLNPYDRPATC